MINKKGSHVGIVLSFVIFVTFLMFFYLMVKPAMETESKRTTLNNLKGDIIEMASEEMTKVSIFVNSHPSQPCAILLGFFDIGIRNKILVLDEDGESVTVTKNDEDLYLDRELADDTFFKIYGSEEFSEIDERPINPCVDGGYELGLVKNTTEVFETKIIEIIEKHEDDYQELKQDLDVPAANEFGLNFTYANGESVSTTDASTRASVFAEEFPVKYVTDEGGIEVGVLRVKVW